MQDREIWVFGYGSLMWNPGFEVAEQQIARLHGYRRSFCMWSIHHRGTEENPGLVLALDADHGAYCDGVALRVPDAHVDTTLGYLRERELVSSAYLEQICELKLEDGREVEAVTYIVDPDHVQYCGGLPLERQAEVITRAVGGRGPNPEYLFNTVTQLDTLGIRDHELVWLVERVRHLETTGRS
ncbi:MAG: gamma-glutamylcyclotransferase [Paracoccaceae bacterium]